jgi:hypothetical protein
LIQSTSGLTANRALTLNLNDAARSIALSGDLVLAGNLTTSGSNTLTLTTTGPTNVTLPLSGTLATLAGGETLTNKTIGSSSISAIAPLGIVAASGTLNINASNLSSGTRTLTMDMQGANRTIALTGDLSSLGTLTIGATGFVTSLTPQVTPTALSLPASGTGTLATLENAETLALKTLTSPTITGATALSLATGGFNLTITPAALGGANRALTLDVGGGDRTLTLAGNLTTSGSNALTLTTVGATNVTLPTTGTLATLAGVETLTNKTLSGTTITAAAGISVAVGGNNLTFAGATLGGANRALTFDMQSGDRTLTLGGALTLASSLTTSGANALTLTTTGATDVTLPTTGTLATLAGAETLTNKALTATTLQYAASSGGGTLTFGATGVTAGRTLTFNLNNANRQITFTGDLTCHGTVAIGSNGLTTEIITQTNGTIISLPASGTGTLATLDGAETLTNKTIVATSFSLDDSNSAFNTTIASTSSLTANRTLTLNLNDAARSISLGGNLTLGGALITSGASALTLTTTGATDVTLPTSGTLATLAGAETLSNKTIVNPAIQASNGLTALSFSAVGSAVNAFRITHAATGGDPTLTAEGSDTNVGFRFDAKGSGKHTFFAPTAGAELRLREAIASGSDYVGLAAPSSVTTAYTMTLPAAQATASGQTLINNGSGTLTWAAALTDVSVSSPASEQTLVYNGAAWANRLPAEYASFSYGASTGGTTQVLWLGCNGDGNNGAVPVAVSGNQWAAPFSGTILRMNYSSQFGDTTTQWSIMKNNSAAFTFTAPTANMGYKVIDLSISAGDLLGIRYDFVGTIPGAVTACLFCRSS